MPQNQSKHQNNKALNTILPHSAKVYILHYLLCRSPRDCVPGVSRLRCVRIHLPHAVQFGQRSSLREWKIKRRW